MKTLFQFAADLSRTAVVTYTPTCDPSSLVLESVTISADAMPHHFTARAVIFDLHPADMVRAIAAVEDRIRETYPWFRRTGWRAASDGLYIHFTAWTARA